MPVVNAPFIQDGMTAPDETAAVRASRLIELLGLPSYHRPEKNKQGWSVNSRQINHAQDIMYELAKNDPQYRNKEYHVPGVLALEDALSQWAKLNPLLGKILEPVIRHKVNRQFTPFVDAKMNDLLHEINHKKQEIITDKHRYYDTPDRKASQRKSLEYLDGILKRAPQVKSKIPPLINSIRSPRDIDALPSMIDYLVKK